MGDPAYLRVTRACRRENHAGCAGGRTQRLHGPGPWSGRHRRSAKRRGPSIL